MVPKFLRHLVPNWTMGDGSLLLNNSCVATYSRIQMLLRRVIRYVSGVLEGRSRWMRNGANIIGRIAGRATDYLTVNHSRMIQMHVSSGLDSLTHLEERVNLLLSTDLIAQDAVVTQVVLLMNI